MQTREAHGLQWIDRGPETDDYLVFSGHEEPLYIIMKALLPPHGVFLDVGAHVGLWSLRMAQHAAIVYAVEANPDTYATLKTNWSLNGAVLDEAHFQPVNVAAWDSKASVALHDWHGKSSGGSTECRESSDGGIPAMPLDFLNIPQVDLIKIDVEGAEARVLRGLTETIDRCHPAVVVEMHAGTQGVPESVDDEVYTFFSSHNYDCGSKFFVSGVPHVVAKPADFEEEAPAGWKVRVDENL